MQTARESSRQKRSIKRRNSRKKSLSPSDLKCTRGDLKSDSKSNVNRSLSEASVKRHRRSNIQRTLTHPLSYMDEIDNVNIEAFSRSKVEVPPESDESNLPPTSSDRDTEDDVRVMDIKRAVPQRPRWDSGSEMDSLISIAVRKASARRRRTPANPVLNNMVYMSLPTGISQRKSHPVQPRVA
ncbi:hypothetical protein RR46_14906 [Papilio xuthus]|uniref:Uncharacterized protein n=1 Tax=Papilio xuthus TaxID=66420 RepID=A0A194PDR5_PAPXU|nr:hypothetical protein RR46_14906 [Papilio xuthus]